MKLITVLVVLFFAQFIFAEWEVVATYSIPEGAAGLAWDGEFLYCGIYGANGDEFYRIDPANGSSELIFTNPQIGDCFGLTWDGNHLWTTDHPSPSSNPALAYQLAEDGTILSQFNLPDHYMSGIAYENGDFWVATYYDPDGYIYKLDAQGNILQEFAAPDNQPWDLCLAQGFLWMADYWGDALYKIDPADGSLIESHDSQGVDAAGIVYDGEYLWYCDNGSGYDQDFLYKVNIGGGGGLPQIGLDFTDYDFGMIAIGENGSVDLPISNNGDAELMITSADIEAAGFSPIFQPPLLIEPLGMAYIGIMFMPQQWGEYEGVLVIGSNDPIQPEVEVDLSGFGYIMYGDPDNNGVVEAFDAALVLQYVVQLDPAPYAPLPWADWQITGADVDGNGSIEAFDAALIMQFVVGIIDQFPIE